MSPDIESGLVLLAVASAGGFGKGLASAAILEREQAIFSAGIAGGDLLTVEVKEFDGLAQGEEVFLAPIVLEGKGNGGLVILAAVIAQAGELVRVPLAVEDGAEDAHASDAADIADDVVKLEVHLVEGLLHVLNVVGGVADEHDDAGSCAGPRPGHRGERQPGGAHRRGAAAAIGGRGRWTSHMDIGRCAAGDILDMAGVDELDVEAAAFENFYQGEPLDAGGPHDARVDPAGCEPNGQGVAIGGGGAELMHNPALGIATGRNSVEMGFGANVDAGCIQIDVLKLWGKRRGASS